MAFAFPRKESVILFYFILFFYKTPLLATQAVKFRTYIKKSKYFAVFGFGQANYIYLLHWLSLCACECTIVSFTSATLLPTSVYTAVSPDTCRLFSSILIQKIVASVILGVKCFETTWMSLNKCNRS